MMPPDIKIISAHGRDYGLEELKEYQRMIADTFAVVANEVDKGAGLEELKRSDLLRDWKKWEGFRSTDDWIETIFHSLTWKRRDKQKNTTTKVKIKDLGRGFHKLFINDFVNIFAFSGPEGVLLVDSGFRKNANEIRDALKSFGGGGIKYIINTHADYDHVDGNRELGRDAVILGHANCRKRITGYISSGIDLYQGFPESCLPSVTFEDSMSLFFNSEEIRLIYLEGCHTDADIVVHFPKAGLLCMGDIIIPDSFPVVKLDQGGRVEDLVKNLKRVQQMFPAHTRLVVGHGRDTILTELREYLEMLTGTIRAVKLALKRGLSLDEMKKNSIFKEWASYSGAVFEELNSDMWMETVYKSLTEKKKGT
jgi:glyoxylase-like metal-dependent hydrolase (beta-lactamase superfamily II)